LSLTRRFALCGAASEREWIGAASRFLLAAQVAAVAVGAGVVVASIDEDSTDVEPTDEDATEVESTDEDATEVDSAELDSMDVEEEAVVVLLPESELDADVVPTTVEDDSDEVEAELEPEVDELTTVTLPESLGAIPLRRLMAIVSSAAGAMSVKFGLAVSSGSAGSWVLVSEPSSGVRVTLYTLPSTSMSMAPPHMSTGLPHGSLNVPSSLSMTASAKSMVVLVAASMKSS